MITVGTYLYFKHACLSHEREAMLPEHVEQQLWTPAEQEQGNHCK